MARIVEEKWQCDRCKMVLSVAPNLPWPRTSYAIEVNVDYAEAAGPSFSWSDMCAHCAEEVGKQVDQMIESAQKARDPGPPSTGSTSAWKA